jgi:hypothetical protein
VVAVRTYDAGTHLVGGAHLHPTLVNLWCLAMVRGTALPPLPTPSATIFLTTTRQTNLLFIIDGLVKSLQNANFRNIEVNNFKCLQSRKLRFSTFYETIIINSTKLHQTPAHPIEIITIAESPLPHAAPP